MHVAPHDDLVVIGDLLYGGYRVLVDGLNTDSVVYSVGLEEDIRFDLGLIARFGCTIHAMDPVARSSEFARSAAAHEPRFAFHQVALWSEDEALTFMRHAKRVTFLTPRLICLTMTLPSQRRGARFGRS